MRLGQVAARIARESKGGAVLRQAVVSAVAGNTVSLKIGGSTVPVPGVRYANHLTLLVNDTVWVAVQPPDMWVIAKLA